MKPILDRLKNEPVLVGKILLAVISFAIVAGWLGEPMAAGLISLITLLFGIPERQAVTPVRRVADLQSQVDAAVKLTGIPRRELAELAKED